MGTEFDCAIHRLAASLSREEFPCCGLDERGYSRAGKQKESIVGRSGSARMSEFIGKPTDECCLESVRRKMHVQEDIFRKQVRELHRLYSKQKKLMGEVKKDMGQNRFSSPMKSPDANSIHCPHKMDETAAYGCAFHLHQINDDRGSEDRSASSSGEATRFLRSLDPWHRREMEHRAVEEMLLQEGAFVRIDNLGQRRGLQQQHGRLIEDFWSRKKKAALIVLNVTSTGGCTKAPRNSVSKNPLITR